MFGFLSKRHTWNQPHVASPRQPLKGSKVVWDAQGDAGVKTDLVLSRQEVVWGESTQEALLSGYQQKAPQLKRPGTEDWSAVMQRQSTYGIGP